MAKAPKDKADDGVSCLNCKYWREQTESSDEVRWGWCRIRAPKVTGYDDEGTPHCDDPWTVLPYDCGEHSPRLQ